MLALKRLPEKHTLIKLAAQTNKRTQILIQTGTLFFFFVFATGLIPVNKDY